LNKNIMKPLFYYTLISTILLFLFTTCSQKRGIYQVQGITSQNGMVVTAHPDASLIGVEILKKGGNAVDAAIAVQFALAVAYPGAGNIGGGGFLVYRQADGSSAVLDFREKAPAMASENMFLNEVGEVIHGLSLSGHLAAGVPGSVDGMVKAYEKFGTLPWKELIQPAIDLAKDGVVLTERESRGLNSNKNDFVEYNTHSPYLVKNEPWQKEDILIHEDLARTLERVRDNGRDGFYSGETAELIVKEMVMGGGIITKEDLQNYQAVWRDPLIGKYKEYNIISVPPPSSGGVALLQLMGIVENFDLKKLEWQRTGTVHIMTEAEKRAFADRAAYLGDPDFIEIPVDELLDRKYLRERALSIPKHYSTPSETIKEGSFAMLEKTETTHSSIVDKWGNAASVTTTLNGSYGSKVIVKDAGFLLNNEMDDFSIKPGTPNLYGLIGGKANAIAPGKRMLSSMTPTIVEKEGNLFMVVGTPGGSTIITSVFQVILNVVEHEMTMQEAVNARRFHHQWLPDIIKAEQGAFSNETLMELQKMGHQIETVSQMGRVDAILLKDNLLEGAADPRGDDTAAGY
jgi:gamma-glutamyltranspeptidase/glutathione hydrolase